MFAVANRKNKYKLFGSKRKHNKEQSNADASELGEHQECNEHGEKPSNSEQLSNCSLLLDNSKDELISANLAWQQPMFMCPKVPTIDLSLQTSTSQLPSCGLLLSSINNSENSLENGQVGQNLRSDIESTCCVDSKENLQREVLQTHTLKKNFIQKEGTEGFNGTSHLSTVDLLSCKEDCSFTNELDLRITSDCSDLNVMKDICPENDVIEDEADDDDRRPLLAGDHEAKCSDRTEAAQRTSQQHSVDILCDNIERLTSSEKSKSSSKKRRKLKFLRKRRLHLSKKKVKHYALKSGKFLWKGLYESAKLVRTGFVIYVGGPFGSLNFESNIVKAYEEKQARTRTYYDYSYNTKKTFGKEKRI